MQQQTKFRFTQAVLVIASLVGMAFALYLQYFKQLEPCPLCVFQRVGIIAMGAVSFVGCIHAPQRLFARVLYLLTALLTIGWSIAVAARHVWLQYLPADQVPSCGPGLDYWMEALPLLQVFELVLTGSGECAKISWQLFGFSIPELSLAYFSAIAVFIIFCLLKVNKPTRY